MAPSRAPPPEVDDDPVEKEYDVYITAPLDPSTRLYLLQHPTRDRDQAYTALKNSTPLELRVKPKAGFVELDVPINTEVNYNAAKARQWGDVLDQTKLDGGFGIASGLAIPQPARSQGRGGRGRGAGTQDSAAATVAAEASASTAGTPEKDMKHQTLGGQILSRERGAPTYMIGTFEGEKLHLTPLSGLVQMRPQFHHLDAQAVAERYSRARATQESAAGRGKAGGADGAAATAAATAAAAAAAASATKAVLSTTKATTNDNEDASATSTKQLLELAQAESWSKLKYYDQEEEEAYEAYAEKLFLREDGGPVTQLVSTMTNEEYLDAISAPRNDPYGKTRAAKQARAGKKSKEAIEVSDESDSDGDGDGDVDMDDVEVTERGDLEAAAAELRG